MPRQRYLGSTYLFDTHVASSTATLRSQLPRRVPGHPQGADSINGVRGRETSRECEPTNEDLDRPTQHDYRTQQ